MLVFSVALGRLVRYKEAQLRLRNVQKRNARKGEAPAHTASPKTRTRLSAERAHTYEDFVFALERFALLEDEVHANNT